MEPRVPRRKREDTRAETEIEVVVRRSGRSGCLFEVQVWFADRICTILQTPVVSRFGFGNLTLGKGLVIDDFRLAIHNFAER